jgi:hypothetical protein
MKAEAWGALRHVRDHLLAEGVNFQLGDAETDGSVSVTFKTHRPFDVNGEYYVRLTFTATEMDIMNRQSHAGTAKRSIQPPVPRGAGMQDIKRRI